MKWYGVATVEPIEIELEEVEALTEKEAAEYLNEQASERVSEHLTWTLYLYEVEPGS